MEAGLSKIRVLELAGEFGISPDETMALLRALEITVRNPASPLTDEQIARARVRWERDKRTHKAAAEAPPAKKKAGAKSDGDAEAKPAAKKKAASKKAPEPEPAPAPAEEAKTTRRRRAADVQKAEEEAAAAAEVVAAAAAAAEAERVAKAARDAEEAARLAKIAEEQAAARARADEAERQRAAEAAAAAAAAAPTETPAAPSASAAPAAPAAAAPPRPAAPSTPRPRPVAPMAPRPRPVNAGGMPPRPIASATPGGGMGGGRREDRGGSGGGGGGARPGTPGSNFGPNATPSSGPRRGKKGKRVDQEAVTANISRTMRQMGSGPAKRRGGRVDESAREELAAIRAEMAEREKTTVRVNEFITVSELAEILKTPATQIVSFAFKHLGLMVTINQRMDFDQIELIASEFGFTAMREEDYAAAPEIEEKDAAEDLKFRSPVVTIMGHVDHGKTSLLDYIRKATVVAGEAGGITQHIGAYHVTLPDGRQITFLDTPGHEAFTAMRARGAQVTDIVVLVVAADDAVMPQTIEAISHAKNAGVPIIVAINKIDLPSANPMKVRQDLLQHGVVLEDFGGSTLSSEISAKKGTGVPALLEQILLQAEILDLKANPDRRAIGSVVEAQLDAGKGAVATILVQNGTLRVGDDFICGLHSGRVRALLDERGKPVKEAGPAIPVQVLGLTGVPMAGDQFICVADAQEAREIAQRRERLDREAKSRRTAKGAVSLEDFMANAASGEKRQLKLLIKADQGGPAEALADALQQLSNEEVQVEVVARAVGAVTESDILLAKASGAVIIGFHVRPDTKARAAADREGVEIKLYRIIYEAVSDVRLALEGLLRPEVKEVVYAEAEVRDLFKVPKIGVIAGCSVRSGTMDRKGRVRVVRDSIEIYDGVIGSLRRFKDDVKEVKEGYECGIGIENFNDLKVGDIIEAYRSENVARTLQPAQA
jgi:translation initiation factor IF-2